MITVSCTCGLWQVDADNVPRPVPSAAEGPRSEGVGGRR